MGIRWSWSQENQEQTWMVLDTGMNSLGRVGTHYFLLENEWSINYRPKEISTQQANQFQATKLFRSYFSDFLLENCKRYRIAHGAKYEVHFLLMDIEVVVTLFKAPQRFSIDLFETTQFTERIAPNSCQGQPTKCHLNKCKVLKLCCLFVCRWLLINPSKKVIGS